MEARKWGVVTGAHASLYQLAYNGSQAAVCGTGFDSVVGFCAKSLRNGAMDNALGVYLFIGYGSHRGDRSHMYEGVEDT